MGDRYYSRFGQEYTPDQVYTMEEGGKGEILAFFYRGAVCGSGGGLSFVEGMLRDQVFGETFRYYFSKNGPGACISF